LDGGHGCNAVDHSELIHDVCFGRGSFNGKSRQGICWVLLARPVADDEVKLAQLRRPPLFQTPKLSGFEVSQWIIVGVDSELRPEKVAPELFGYGPFHCEELQFEA
jgi:hypothetical protein